MFFYLVVLLSLSWPHVIGTGSTDLRDEAAFDQIATASENVEQNAENSKQKQEFRNQLITSMIDTTVHYENSNGFMPMMESSSSSPLDLPPSQPDTTFFPLETVNVTWSNSLDERENSSSSDDKETNGREVDKFENDPAYSTEARIFLNFPNLNRRSFEFQGNQNEFELLKVGNDTPEVANYPQLYEEPANSNENEDERTKVSSKHKTYGKGQKMEDYVGNYGIVFPENNSEGTLYSYYYPRTSAKDKEKKSRDQEKAASNYQQENVPNYDGREQSATGGMINGPTGSSFPRTNQEVNAFSKNDPTKEDHSYGMVPPSSPQVTKNQRFSRPVVVAEANYQFNQPPRISDSGIDDFQTSRFIDSVSSEMSHRYTMDNRNGRFRSNEDSRDTSDDGDYMEYTERPRRVQKSRRRPGDSSKRLPKEHRGSLEDSAEYESQGKRHHSSRSKPYRQRARGNSWLDDDRYRDQDDSYEDARYDGRLSGSEMRHVKSQNSKFKPSNSWNQISPNLEISHSSGIEVGQLEKPKLIVPVKVNLVPVTNFDHATAIGNSQGFDVSNAILRNIVTATPLSTVGTPASTISTAENAIGHESKMRMSTPVPDIIFGQNSFHNSMHAVLPQMNEQNRFSTNFKPQYLSSTVAPVFAVTPGLNGNLQSVPIQDVQDASTPRPAIIGAPNQMSTNHVPQLILPQPTVQTVSTLVQTPVTNSDYIQVNPHGMHGQNAISHGNLQVQTLPTLPTITPTAQSIPVTKINLVTSDSQNKKTLLPGPSTNFLASASLAVGHNDERQTFNGNNYYLQNSNTQQMVKPQVQGGLYQQAFKNVNVVPKTKTYIQTTHLLPAVLQPLPTFTSLSANTQQEFPEHQSIHGSDFVRQKIQNSDLDNGASTLKNVPLAYQTFDSVGSHSNINTVNASPGVPGIIENAHLPHVGMRNVEIVNPNIKPSPVDTAIINSYETMHYPGTVLTTSIPMFTTTSFVTARPAILSSTTESSNLQNVVNSLTEIGSNNQAFGNDLKAYQSLERPVFNPINFIPNVDVVKNQNALNSKLHVSEPLQQSLNLVPLIPGGNFFKPSFTAQSELLVKPKLSSDLESYAEQMFKESLKTIYNSQKWNNDRKPGNNRQNVSDLSDITKLKNELQRLKASLSDSKRNKEQIEAHHSETKVRTELPSKKPDELLAALEQMLKNHPTDSYHGYYGNNKPHRHRRPIDQDKYSSDFRDTKHIREFLTPPQLNSHRSKGHFHEKPGKKRPGPGRYNHHNHHHGPRSHTRSSLSHKAGGIETSASNIDPVRVDGFSKYENAHDSRHFWKSSPYDSYSSVSMLSRDKSNFPTSSKQRKVVDSKENIYNHPKVHNFLGLMMKNKQLPNGNTPSYFRDQDQLKDFFEDETQRTQQKFYDDSLRDYFYKMSDGTLYSNLGHVESDARRSLSEKRTG
ncbi:PREDICTED: uncharacterized protein LOC108548423 [Eufriesea mexicana]|uniref:uncharacterized protein LOC108548423 n=1 Tax=Eufriesea mexicana TaxID=516756 RepID=UPI00083C544B|nr:PREDICTED: uncharacterized protein LOC108548423 [Eufriesea mexicana]